MIQSFACLPNERKRRQKTIPNRTLLTKVSISDASNYGADIESDVAAESAAMYLYFCLPSVARALTYTYMAIEMLTYA